MRCYVNLSFLNIKPMTGLSRFALTMCYGLKEALGDKVVFLLPSGPFVHQKIAEELGAIRIGYNKKRTRWEQIDLPIYLMRKGSPLLISFGNTAPLYYSNQIVSVLDIFYHKLDSILPEHKKAYPWIEIQYYRFIVPRILRSAKAILTISDYSKSDISENFGIDSSKIRVVYPSIPDTFSEAQLTDSPARYGKYILGVSSVNPRKNFEGLIRAFKKAELDGVNLVIVGDFSVDSERYSLYNLFKDDKTIQFTGYVTDDELKGLYSNALFFAYPSFYEGFGIPPLEAMMCGCPTMVSNVTSLPEVCGPASLYVDPYDIDDMARGMRELSQNKELRAALIEEGYKRVSLFRKDASILKLTSMLHEVQNSL